MQKDRRPHILWELCVTPRFTPFGLWKNMKSLSSIIVVLSVAILFATPKVSSASDTAERLQQSLHRLEFWLGTGANADGWRRFLYLNQLDAQSALGDRAEIHMLQQVLQRFESRVNGLDHVHFQTVRANIHNHIQFLIGRNAVDIDAALSSAKYQPISRAKVVELQQRALLEYQFLVGYYRTKMFSRARAELLFELKTDDAINLLKEIDMAVLMPDANSENQLSDEDRKAKRSEWLTRLRAVTNAINDQNLNLNDHYYASTQIALDRFVRIYFYATDPSTPRVFERELKTIQENLASLNDPTQRSKHAILGNSLGWMQSTAQMPELISIIRAKHSLPNLYVSISSKLINTVATRPVNQTQPVNEVILGRLSQGWAYTHGNVTMDLIHDPYQAHVNVHFLSSIHSDTYTRQGKITAFTESNGLLEARRSIYANVAGFFAGSTSASANMHTNFLGTDSRFRIVQKIADKTYWRDKYAAEGIASRRAETRILNEFTAETDTALADGSSRYAELVEKVEPFGQWIPEAYLSTTHAKVVVTGHKANAFDLAANDSPVTSFVVPDVGVQLHETFLTNYLTPLFANKTMTNQQMADRIYELGSQPPEGLEPEDEDDVFSITFAQIQPIRVQFDDDRLTVSVTGRRFARGGRNIRTGLVIQLSFKVVNENNKLFLIRDGESSIEYVDPDAKSARIVAFKNFLEGKLNEASVEAQKVELPPNMLPLEMIEVDDHDDVLKNLRLVQFNSSGGWLQVGWQHLPGTVASYSVDTPSIHDATDSVGTLDENAPGVQTSGTTGDADPSEIPN